MVAATNIMHMLDVLQGAMNRSENDDNTLEDNIYDIACMIQTAPTDA